MTTIGKAGYLIAIVYLSLCSTIFAQNPQQVVAIPDPNLRSALREALSLPNDQPITEGRIGSLTRLSADRRGIEDLTGLEYATNLRVLQLGANDIHSLEPLKLLVRLDVLYIYRNPRIKSIKPLMNLTTLTQLHAGGCEITNIAPVRNLTNLVLLDFSRQWGLRHDPQRGLVDIEPLSNLTKLHTLNLSYNRISDIKPLTNLAELTWLALNSNQIVDVRPLVNLVNLNTLLLQFNHIVDVSPLVNLIHLEELHIASNPLHDFSPLFELEGVELDIEISEELNVVVEVPDPNLRRAIREALNLPDDIPLTQLQMLRLEGLDAGGNRGIADLTGLEYAANLKGLGLFHNPIVDISTLAHLTKLESFNLWGCQIVDLTALRNLKNLKSIYLGGNEISDISPLSELTNLTFLDLRSNNIEDVSPLTNLLELEELRIAGNPIHDFSPLFELEGVKLDIEISEELNIVVEVLDQNLRDTIREALKLPDNVPLTQLQMLRLEGLNAGGNRGITDLTGLEYAANLRTLGLHHNPIVDISNLAHLTKLEGFNLWGCQIFDLTPLRNLKNLRSIHLGGNEISDISPLSELTNLTFLDLRSNHIEDVRPLANLVNLKTLLIEHNLIVDHSPLDALDMEEFTRDECCEEPRLSINERLQSRTFPSVFAAWGGIGWSSVLNQPHLSDIEQMSQHDLWFGGSGFGLRLRKDGEGIIKGMGNINRARQERDEFLAMNPNMLFLLEVRMLSSENSEDSPYWIRDEQGNILPGWLDFTHPVVQDSIVNEALAIFRCGLWDGVMFDWWNEDWPTLNGYRTIEQERTARLNIVSRIREATGDDFLIICNGNRRTFPITAPYINGTFMETLRDNDSGYTYEGLIRIETTLTWAEENLRKPKINALEGWGITSEQPDSPTNLRWMRVFTTMGLTHSDGYVLYTDGIQHDHYWYSFWEANLGRPVSEKRVQYDNRDGVFVREFTNGWAVYNRSGETQQIQLSEEVIGVESGQRGTSHNLPDLDGEIYLKVVKQTPWDVNQDGTTDVFDLVAVAKNFGQDNPVTDLNDDGTVDIFDLVLVARHLGESTNPAAPVVKLSRHNLSPRTVQEWIDMAHLADDGSLAFREGIANLQRLLSSLVPDETVLLKNYPNPFNPETWIPYHLAANADVTVTIYNLQGKIVRHLDLGLQEAGYYVDKIRAVHWDGTNDDGESVASGVYFYKLDAGEFTASKRMVILK